MLLIEKVNIFPFFVISLRAMKQSIFILLIIISSVSALQAQRSGSEGRKGFSMANLNSSSKEVPDSLLVNDSTQQTKKNLTAYRLTDKIGDAYITPLDTGWINFYNTQQVEGRDIAVGYLSNMGSPAQSKIFMNRKEERDFVFEDVYDYYRTTPTNALFYNTKIPYTDLTYIKGGANVNREERLKGVLTMNFGPKINIGADIDYIYSRGYYNSLSQKTLTYRLFGSYISDRYEAHAYLDNFNAVNYENGGITNDLYITNPDRITGNSKQKFAPKDIPVKFTDTWNRVRGKRYFLTHRYNLGFHKDVEIKSPEGDSIASIFVPVSSIIHTFDYSDNRRRFTSRDNGIDTCFTNSFINGLPDDTTKAWSLKNTIGLSLREGFQDWAKFGITAFVTFEQRKFTQMDSIAVDPGISLGENNTNFTNNRTSLYTSEFSTVIGAEISKRMGTLLTYNARGELAVIGDDIGEFRINGELQTKFKLFKKDASIRAYGYIKNARPAYYIRTFHSKFFWWDNNFSNTQRIFAGADIDLRSSNTKLSAGVESIQNYIYFNTIGVPQQTGTNLQVITARAKQDFHFGAFNWENEAVYQLSSDKKVLPLPQLSLYSNLYVTFKIAKVLHLQLGADVHYQTKYHAPYYQPATMQFQTQDEVLVGNYPLINGYANLKLKQARFFVMFYNVGKMFVSPDYFSLAHYPLDPMILKLGLSVTFNN